MNISKKSRPFAENGVFITENGTKWFIFNQFIIVFIQE